MHFCLVFVINSGDATPCTSTHFYLNLIFITNPVPHPHYLRTDVWKTTSFSPDKFKMSSSLVRTIVLLLAAMPTSGLLQCPNTENQCSSFAVLRYPNYYLGCGSTVNTLESENLEACVKRCLMTPYCFSTNVKHSNEGSKCELLKTKKKVTPRRCLIYKDGWEHIEMTVRDHFIVSLIL